MTDLGPKRETEQLERGRDFFSHSGLGRVFTPRFITIRLQPQMKKYRCLWCKSRINHYILYLVHDSGLLFPNKGTCLWKARDSLARRGFQGLNLSRFEAVSV